MGVKTEKGIKKGGYRQGKRKEKREQKRGQKSLFLVGPQFLVEWGYCAVIPFG
jgi:hypothetical protein